MSPPNERRGFAADLCTFLVRQAPILFVANVIYLGARVIVEGSPELARRNAERLLRVEETIHIDIERGLQDIVLAHGWLVDASNWVYVWMYWPFVIGGLAIVHHLDRSRYLVLRNAIFVAGAAGLVIFALVPVAPPRFMPGFVGTVSDGARQHHLGHDMRWANLYAALPSFHAGWTLAVSITLAQCAHTWLMRGLALLPGILMSLAVITTANHYVVDVLVGHTMSVTALCLIARVSPRRRGSRRWS